MPSNADPLASAFRRTYPNLNNPTWLETFCDQTTIMAYIIVKNRKKINQSIQSIRNPLIDVTYVTVRYEKGAVPEDCAPGL